jgi:hypothetical protein
MPAGRARLRRYESGHTWHHPDGILFAITRSGLVPPHAPRPLAAYALRARMRRRS